MIAVDTNVLVHAYRQDSPEHGTTRARVVSLAESPSSRAISEFCIGEFVRFTTRPRPFHAPHAAQGACEALSRLLASPGVTVPCLGAE